MPRHKPLHERFEASFTRGAADECWEWTKARHKAGYGAIGANGRRAYGHRVSYELNVGPIPPGMCVLHRCDNPPCVNPSHLFLGTLRDNTQDMLRKGRHRTNNVRGDDHWLRRSPRAVAGERNPAAKLSTAQATNLRIALALGARQVDCAEWFGIDQTSVSRIWLGRRYTESAHATV